MERKRADDIADEIERMILEGIYPDGARLDESQLALRFSVSRTPIREAFQRLSLSGLVAQMPRRGVFVRQPGPVELIEMFEVMAELEAVAVRLSARRISETGLAALEAINERCRMAVRNGDADLYYEENEGFHALLYQQSGNAFLEAECTRLQRRLRPYRRRQLHLRGRMDQSMAEHEAIVEALQHGDEVAAGEAMRAHVSVQGEKFHYLIAGLGLPRSAGRA